MNEKVKLTKEAFQIDAQQGCSAIEAFIKQKYNESFRDGIVVSISGGLDSSVTAALCTRAIGKEKVVGLMLPERFGNPEANLYGRMIAKHLEIKTVQLNISPILRGLGTSDIFLSAISGREFWKDTVNKILQKRGHSAEGYYIDALKGTLDPVGRKLLAKVSSKQRARLLTVYKFAEENNYMVAGSAHKTEQMVGLFVKYGVDDCADIMPLKNIFRSHTLQLAEYLGIPDDILHRSPNPDILPGITDKYIGYFNMDYLMIDLILLGLQEGLPDDEIAVQIGIGEQFVNQMREVVRLSENTRNHELAPIITKNKLVAGKTIQEWTSRFQLINNMIDYEEVFWINPKYTTFNEAMKKINLTEDDVKDAEERLNRFAPFIMAHFPETKNTNGIIESPVVRIPNMQQAISRMFEQEIPGDLILKMDSHLAIAGSIKARGGIYEVLKHTEDLVLENNLITLEDDFSKLAQDEYRKFFNQYTIQVGSTGNLGLSIGIMSAKVGYKVVVHMSSDAKQWKKDLLRSKGVTVVEYSSDYSEAVKEGRKLSDADPMSYFVDDENSENLFLGYSVAASRLKKQLEDMDIIINSDKPLFVYLPCGVGGGPGGVAFGLKLIFKDNVHCFFAEPTHSPCMLLGMMTEKNEEVCVQDFGIDNITAADGLAVGRPSGFVGKTLKELLSGIYTVQDDKLHALLSILADTEKIYLEPSACAGIPGIVKLFKNESHLEYLKKNNLTDKMSNSVHIAWATGGSLVPKESMDEYYRLGLEVLNNYGVGVNPKKWTV